jgi:hypothetical protein
VAWRDLGGCARHDGRDRQLPDAPAPAAGAKANVTFKDYFLPVKADKQLPRGEEWSQLLSADDSGCARPASWRCPS